MTTQTKHMETTEEKLQRLLGWDAATIEWGRREYGQEFLDKYVKDMETDTKKCAQYKRLNQSFSDFTNREAIQYERQRRSDSNPFRHVLIGKVR